MYSYILFPIHINESKSVNYPYYPVCVHMYNIKHSKLIKEYKRKWHDFGIP
jgi:hypothetical protein